MFLICPVRPGDINEELRYALRSWETNLLIPSGLTLVVVGHCPRWLAPDVFVEGNKYRSMPFAVFDNIKLGTEAVLDKYTPDEVIYMNDDFFCLDPVPGIVPVRREISLEKHVAKFQNNTASWWPKSLSLTYEWLKHLGYHNPASFEVHRPLLADPTLMLGSLNAWLDSDFAQEAQTVPQWRTIYGVLNNIEAHPVKDMKLGLKSNGNGAPWISTSDTSWRRFAPAIKKRFQKPSQWELDN